MPKRVLVCLSIALIFAPISDAYATAVTASRGNDADDLANGAAFDNNGAWTLSVADDASFTTGVITTAGNGGASAGTVTFLGTSTVNTAASASVIGTGANALNTINAGADGETVTLNGDVFATTFNVTGTGTVNADSITATTVHYAGDGTISVDNAEHVTSAVTTASDGTGTLTLEGTSTVSGQVGTESAALKAVRVAGTLTKTATFSDRVFTDSLLFTSGSNAALSGGFGSADFSTGSITIVNSGTITVADDKFIYGTVINGGAFPAMGSFSFSGTSYVSGSVGTYDRSANTMTFNGAGERVTFGSDTYASTFTQSAANAIDIGSNRVVLRLGILSNGGDLTMNANGTLALTVNSGTRFGNITAEDTVTMAATNVIDVTMTGALANGAALAIITGATWC